jgi:hypothetical protein
VLISTVCRANTQVVWRYRQAPLKLSNEKVSGNPEFRRLDLVERTSLLLEIVTSNQLNGVSHRLYEIIKSGQSQQNAVGQIIQADLRRSSSPARRYFS